MADCYVQGKLIQDALCKLATQYRESPKLKAFITVFLTELEIVQKALCDTAELDLDKIGRIANFPRCWCNIKKRKWFGYVTPPEPFFGFAYEEGEEEGDVATGCLAGLDEGRWFEFGDNPDCNLNGCCTVNDPTIGGYCEAPYYCADYPQYEDHCFDDDVEYAKLLQAKLLSDKSTGLVDEILAVAVILFGDATTIIFDEHGSVWLSLNRAITENEIFLMDFYKKLIPVPLSVDVIVVDGLNKQFGYSDSPCLEDIIDGYCSGTYARRY